MDKFQSLIDFVKQKFQRYRSFILFLIIGTIGTFLNAACVYYFVDKLGLYFMIGALISTLIALTSNYSMHRIWTFPDSPEKSYFRGLFKYYFASSIGSVVHLGCLFIIVELFQIWVVFGVFLSTFFSTLWNYLANKKWTFQEGL
jgi:putative flippase GtrA